MDRYYLWGTAIDIEAASETKEEGGEAPADQPLIPEPDGQFSMPYEPVMYPVISHDPSTVRPISVGPVAAGDPFVSVQVGLGKICKPHGPLCGLFAACSS